MIDRAIERGHEADGDRRIARPISQPRLSSLRFGAG
jgi:hypothetical protein